MKSLIIFGNGGHCKACIDVIETNNNFKIKGLISQPNEKLESLMGYKILSDDNNYKKILNKDDYILIGIGQIKSPKLRIKLFDELIKGGYQMATICSKFSKVSKHANINIGTIIMHNVVINPDAKIGSNCIINTSALIEHDVKVSNHCHISTGVILNGGVSVGEGTFIGSGCILREGIKIGERVIISAGQTIMKDLKSDTIFKGEY